MGSTLIFDQYTCFSVSSKYKFYSIPTLIKAFQQKATPLYQTRFQMHWNRGHPYTSPKSGFISWFIYHY